MFDWTCGIFLVDTSCMCYLMRFNAVLHTETLPLNMFELGCSQQYGEPHVEELTGKQIEMVNKDIKTSDRSIKPVALVNQLQDLMVGLHLLYVTQKRNVHSMHIKKAIFGSWFLPFCVATFPKVPLFFQHSKKLCLLVSRTLDASGVSSASKK